MCFAQSDACGAVVGENNNRKALLRGRVGVKVEVIVRDRRGQVWQRGPKYHKRL